jgi:hypothetical protein
MIQSIEPEFIYQFVPATHPEIGITPEGVFDAILRDWDRTALERHAIQGASV